MFHRFFLSFENARRSFPSPSSSQSSSLVLREARDNAVCFRVHIKSFVCKFVTVMRQLFCISSEVQSSGFAIAICIYTLSTNPLFCFSLRFRHCHVAIAILHPYTLICKCCFSLGFYHCHFTIAIGLCTPSYGPTTIH